jgi:hypothetical protein
MVESRINNHAAFIWSVADLLRGDYKQPEYGKVILPLTVLRRLDCVLEPTKLAVLARAVKFRGQVDKVQPVLCAVAGQRLCNTSPLDFPRLLDDPAQVAGNLRAYIAGFSSGAREVLDKLDFDTQITRLARADLLYLVLSRVAEVDLHPDAVSNIEMDYLRRARSASPSSELPPASTPEIPAALVPRATSWRCSLLPALQRDRPKASVELLVGEPHHMEWIRHLRRVRGRLVEDRAVRPRQVECRHLDVVEPFVPPGGVAKRSDGLPSGRARRRTAGLGRRRRSR